MSSLYSFIDISLVQGAEHFLIWNKRHLKKNLIPSIKYKKEISKVVRENYINILF